MTLQVEKLISMYNRSIREYLNTRLKDWPLNESNFYYILIICEHPGMAQKDLVNGIYRQQSIVTKVVTTLIKTGWVDMRTDQNDKRRRNVFPTEQATAAYAALKQIQTDANAFALSGLDGAEASQLGALLAKAIQQTVPDAHLTKEDIN